MGKTVRFTPELRAEYQRLLDTATVRPERSAEVVSLAWAMAHTDNWRRYQSVAAEVRVPAHLVAVLHMLEAGGSFHSHLHNGDPLTGRTVHVPKGRPIYGKPPFAWEASAMDALRLHGLGEWTDWSMPGLLYVLERYNGFGYRLYHASVPSPYLWSFTTAYTVGKYVADGTWSGTAVSKQPGAVALLWGLAHVGLPYAPGADEA